MAVIPSTIAHEFMHSFGIPSHAHAYFCGQETVRPDTLGCRAVDGGSSFDVMGIRYIASHPQALFKEQLGWLPAANIREITEEGEYELFPLDLPSEGTQALKVPLSLEVHQGPGGARVVGNPQEGGAGHVEAHPVQADRPGRAAPDLSRHRGWRRGCDRAFPRSLHFGKLPGADNRHPLKCERPGGDPRLVKRAGLFMLCRTR